MFISESAEQTREIGRNFASRIFPRSEAVVIALEGELGSGKTTFVKGLAEGLGINNKVKSPSFIIMRRYNILSNNSFVNFFHIDCYRIVEKKELLELGWDSLVKDPRSIAVLEWAGRVKDILPPCSIWANFSFLEENKRGIEITQSMF